MSEIKNVIFDLGGVVVKWDPVGVLNGFKGDPAITRYIRERGFFADYWRDYDKGTLSREKLVERTAALIGCSEESCEEFILHVMNSLDTLPGTEELIKELQDHVKRVTAPYKYPRVIEFVDELPKTISGKIRRVEIRQKDNN